MKSILEVVGEELEARERAVTGREGVIDQPQQIKANNGDRGRSSAASLITTQGNGKPTCCYCHGRTRLEQLLRRNFPGREEANLESGR